MTWIDKLVKFVKTMCPPSSIFPLRDFKEAKLALNGGIKADAINCAEPAKKLLSARKVTWLA